MQIKTIQPKRSRNHIRYRRYCFRLCKISIESWSRKSHSCVQKRI